MYTCLYSLHSHAGLQQVTCSWLALAIAHDFKYIVQLGSKVCVNDGNMHIPTSLVFTQLIERTHAINHSKPIHKKLQTLAH